MLLRTGEGLEKLMQGLDFIEIITPALGEQGYKRFTALLNQMAAKADFGIAPLLDTWFNAGKSFLKVIEYAALGLPAIASNVVPYKELEGFPGLILADNTDMAWEDALATKIEDGIANRKSGKAAQEYVLEHSVLDQAGKAEYDEAIFSMLNKGAEEWQKRQ